jgi:hypothetical protein
MIQKRSSQNNIDKMKAKLIAQRSLVSSGEQERYYLEKPLFDDNHANHQKYTVYKFIHFVPKDINSDVGFLVIINSNNGEVIYAGKFNPNVEKGYSQFIKQRNEKNEKGTDPQKGQSGD